MTLPPKYAVRNYLKQQGVKLDTLTSDMTDVC